jgi:DNA polymerase III subunit epsilon
MTELHNAEWVDCMYLIFDCETTGLPRSWSAPISDLSNWPRVIQVAWQLYDGMESNLESSVQLVRPEGFIIPSDVQRIHGITTARALAEGKKLIDVVTALGAAIEKADVLVAHNIQFDEKVVSAEYLRLNLKPPFSNRKRFCTMQNTTELCGIPGSRGYKWPTLAQLYWKLFNSKFDDAHDAGADVAACAKCFFELKHRGVISL